MPSSNKEPGILPSSASDSPYATTLPSNIIDVAPVTIIVCVVGTGTGAGGGVGTGVGAGGGGAGVGAGGVGVVLFLCCFA